MSHKPRSALTNRIRPMKLVALAAVLALVVAARAAQSPERTAELAGLKAETGNVAPRPGGSFESPRNLPIVDGHGELRVISSASRSVSILEDRPRDAVDLRALAGASEAIAVCGAGTTWDAQHPDLDRKKLTTLGGDPDLANIHFTWTHWDVIPESIERVDRFVNYQGFNPSTGFCLQDCGVTVSGGGGDPLLARGGFPNVDVTSADNATLFFHQLNAENQTPESGQFYSSWVLDQGIPCFNLFAEKELPSSVDNGIRWPHGKVDRDELEATDVFHVVARHWDPEIGRTHFYWRRVGATGIWAGPAVLDECMAWCSGYVAVDPTDDDVAVIYHQDGIQPEPALLQVGYMLSTTNGQDWIEDGVSTYPEPLTDHGYSYIQVTNYTDALGPQAWIECGGEFDLNGELHVFWIEQAFADVADHARCKHWSASTGFSTIAEAIGWENQGGNGTVDLNLAGPGVGFGDGTTSCSDGPPNPGPAGPNSNLNYVYYVYEQYGGETLLEQADVCTESDQQNLEIYLATSNDGGATWSLPTNITQTHSPGCDCTPGNLCSSERDPSIAYTINDAIHIMYIVDVCAGDAPAGTGPWTYNPVMYHKIPGGTDADLICPEIAPRFSALITNADPDCEFHAAYSPPGIVNEFLLIENSGNAPMTGIITGYSSDWLTVDGGVYSVAAGESISRSLNMNAGAPSIQSRGEGLYQDSISVTHDDPRQPSPRQFPVDFFVFNGFACPDYVIMHTGGPVPKGMQTTTGELWLEVSNVERIANQNDIYAGLARLGSDSSWSIYDGSLIIGVPPDPDTMVYRNIFGAGNGQPGFRALSELVVDTSAYGTNRGEAWAFADQTTLDSTIGIDVSYVFPQPLDSSEFVLIKYEIYNRTNGDILDLVVGEAIDLDINPRPDSLDNLQSGAQNTGHLAENYNMLYQQGVDSIGHTIVGPPGREVSATRFKGGMTVIQCDSAPRGWIASNDPWLFDRPGGGWHESYLYEEMTKSGFEIFPPSDPDPGEDLHSVLVFEQDIDLAPNTIKYYVLGLVSSNTGITEVDILATTAKAWKYAFGWWIFTVEDSVAHEMPMSYPYYALGTEEGGLGSGCCGCIVSEVEDENDKFTIVPGTDPCEGTVEFAGGSDNGCDYPYEATFRVTDLCLHQAEDIRMTVHSAEGCACDCPWQSDFDEDGFYTALDLGGLIDILFAGAPDIQDTRCPTSRSDLDCDMFPTALDLGWLIDLLFASGPGPCDPCTP